MLDTRMSRGCMAQFLYQTKDAFRVSFALVDEQG